MCTPFSWASRSGGGADGDGRTSSALTFSSSRSFALGPRDGYHVRPLRQASASCAGVHRIEAFAKEKHQVEILPKVGFVEAG